MDLQVTDLGKQARWVDPAARRRTKTSSDKAESKKKRNRSDYIQHRQRLYHVYGSICWLCGEANAAQIDHVIPLSQGGSNDFTNLRLAHDECNLARNRKSHPWHKAPEISVKGFPRKWHGMTLVRAMWDEQFVLRVLDGQGSPRSKKRNRSKSEGAFERQAKWVEPETSDLGKQARWVDPLS